MTVAHYIPWRAIRAGKQLSDSKGASAAISTEVAILSMKRAMAGFVGPKDIFRNPEALFRQFEPTQADSPFDLVLSHSGDDFAVMGMHFKLGLYEHQSAGALQGLIDLIAANPQLLEPGRIKRIVIKAYEPAFGIIGDPAKRDPHTRQSADHSMVYIVGTMLRKMIERSEAVSSAKSTDSIWKEIMLLPDDYSPAAISNTRTREIMSLIEFEHGGPEYDAKYPDGIPTSLFVEDQQGATFDSGLVMYPAGHARNTSADLKGILAHKAAKLGELGMPDGSNAVDLVTRFERIGQMKAQDLQSIYDFEIADRPGYE
jgi:2-methylcitrate dehydratase